MSLFVTFNKLLINWDATYGDQHSGLLVSKTHFVMSRLSVLLPPPQRFAQHLTATTRQLIDYHLDQLPNSCVDR